MPGYPTRFSLPEGESVRHYFYERLLDDNEALYRPDGINVRVLAVHLIVSIGYLQAHDNRRELALELHGRIDRIVERSYFAEDVLEVENVLRETDPPPGYTGRIGSQLASHPSKQVTLQRVIAVDLVAETKRRLAPHLVPPVPDPW